MTYDRKPLSRWGLVLGFVALAVFVAGLKYINRLVPDDVALGWCLLIIGFVIVAALSIYIYRLIVVIGRAIDRAYSNKARPTPDKGEAG